VGVLIRMAISLVIALFGLVSYCGNTTYNPVTHENQRVQLSPRQEVVLGQQSLRQMAAQHGGLYPDQALQTYLDQVGMRIVQKSAAAATQTNYPYDFHLLRDARTINAFALPGGQVFITVALFNRLSSEAQLAGVLGHEIGHVVARHGAQHLAKQQLGQSLVTAVGVAVSDGRSSGNNAQVIAQAANQLVSLRYGRQDELQSDQLGFQFMTEAGYDPRGIAEVMKILAATRQGGQPPQFLSSHPDPGNRFERLQKAIKEKYPQGVPSNLENGREVYQQQILPRLRGSGT
jgi:beta-barrel assembly-enhancing protease